MLPGPDWPFGVLESSKWADPVMGRSNPGPCGVSSPGLIRAFPKIRGPFQLQLEKKNMCIDFSIKDEFEVSSFKNISAP